MEAVIVDPTVEEKIFTKFHLIFFSTIGTGIVLYYVILGSLPNPNDKSVSEEEIKKNISDFNKQRFLNDAYQTYLNVQKSWSNFDTDSLRKMLSDELYNTYNSQLKVLKAKKQKNIISNFIMDRIDINNVNVEGEKITLTCILKVEFYDYIVDSDEKIVRGTNEKKLFVKYKLTFISTIKQKRNRKMSKLWSTSKK